MDWEHSFEDYLIVNPRGHVMDGGLNDSSLQNHWKSKYGSVVTSVNGWLSTKVSSYTGNAFDFVRDGATDGINEAGLAAHVLYLEATEYPLNIGAPVGVTYMRWTRFLLDNFATVDEAVDGMRGVQIANVHIREPGTSEDGASLGAHVAIEDASGDSAIFEVINGSVVVHHGRSANYTVLTNDPPFPEQLEGLKRYKAFGGEAPLPGDTSSVDRFVRMAYFMQHLPDNRNVTLMTGFLNSVIKNAAVPHGAPYAGDQTYPTWWTSIVDFQHRVYYWNWAMNQNMIHVNLSSLIVEKKFEDGAPYLVMNPRIPTLVGDVSGKFEMPTMI